jgi:hypothetical protein
MHHLRLVQGGKVDDDGDLQLTSDDEDLQLTADEALALLDVVFLCEHDLTDAQERAIWKLSAICRRGLHSTSRPPLRMDKAA